MSVIPAVLLNALREYSFVGSPLWRMSDRVELTFHKNLPTPRFYKKKAVSRRQPAPSAGEWPRQPAQRPTTTRPTTARRPTICVEKETPPPPALTLPDTTLQDLPSPTTALWWPYAEDSHHRDSTYHHSTNKHRLLHQTARRRRRGRSHQQRQPARRRALPATSATTSHTHYMRSTNSRESPWSRWWIPTSWLSKDSDSNAQMRRST